MDEKRKAWCKKYQVKMADGGFIEKYCAPEHVKCMLPNPDAPINELIYIGWDGRETTWEGLTEEEKQDYEEKIKDNNFAQIVHYYDLKEREEKKYRERTRRIKNICYTEQEKFRKYREEALAKTKFFIEPRKER